MEMPEISNGETIKINDYAFNGTQHLFGSNIDIASKLAEEFFKNISYIGPYAFMNCRVREKGATFILPETVYYVGTEAFTHIYGGVSAF